MADKAPPPPPKPPQRPPKPLPTKPPMPPKPPTKAPPPPKPPTKAPSPPKPPTKAPSPPKKKKTAPPKGKPAPKKKKRRRIKINTKLGLRQKKITDQEDTYTDQIGWTAMGESFEDYEDPTPTEPEIVTHQCSMCGSTMKIPRPKRERYKVICAYPECGHSDMVGI
jgi:hypothetical protein